MSSIPLMVSLSIFLLPLTVAGDMKKPSYLYDTPGIHILATRTEPQIYLALHTYVGSTNASSGHCCIGNQKQGRATLGLMQRYILDYESSSIMALNGSTNGSSSRTAIQLVSNPILVHKLITRFTRILPLIVIGLMAQPQNEAGETFLQSVRLSQEAGLMPPTRSDDLLNSLESIHRIQRFHNFEAKDLAEGRLGTLNTGMNLSALEAFDLGQTARNMDLASAVEWLETCLEMLDREGGGEDFDEFRNMVQKVLDEAVVEHDDVCFKPVWNPEMETCFTSLINSNYYRNFTSSGVPKHRVKAWLTNQKKSAPLYKETGPSPTDHLFRNFISTCAGNILMTHEDRSKLHCWYEWKKAAYLTIAPLKFEQLSASPELYQIYDILGPNKIRPINRCTASRMVRSLVTGKAGDSLSDQRTSVQTWLNESGFLDSISRQIEVATGLNVRHTKGRRGGGEVSEKYLVASYRPSHHFDLHTDPVWESNEETESRDRLATFMFYLSDVEVGGWTGFPVAGVAARPVSGSAIFWYNLMKNGDVDHSTWHGGCPVAYGVKVVMTKWILYKQNFDKRLCSLNPEE